MCKIKDILMTKLGLKLKKIIEQDKIEPTIIETDDIGIYNLWLQTAINVHTLIDECEFGVLWHRVNKNIYRYIKPKRRLYGSFEY